MDPQRLNVWVAAGAVVLLVAVLAVRLSVRTGLPSLLLYLGLGLAIGEDGLGVEFDDYQLAQNLGLLALAVILAEGGLTTRWRVIRAVTPCAVLLSTAGVVVSVAVVAAGAYWLLDFDLRTALLLGAIVSSTDAAAVFAVLRVLPLRRRLVATLEAESGFNDAPVVILVTLLVSDAWDEASVWASLGAFTYQLLGGAVLGVGIARVGQELLVRSAFPSAGLYPLTTLAICLLAYATAGLAGASGFIAVYLCGLWLGNATLPHRRATLGFTEVTALLAQIGLFVLLGLLASPERLPDAALPALVSGFVLTFLARPASVLLTATWFRYPWREQVFLSWAGLRGAVPIVLTTLPATAGVPGFEQVFDTVFLLVVVYTLLQGPTLPWVARRLRVTDDMSPHDMAVEAAPLEELNADLLQVWVPATSRLVGVTVPELRLPAEAAVVLVVRGGRSIVPDAHFVFRGGDQVLIVAREGCREAAETRLRAVHRGGRLAGWYARSRRPGR